MKSDNLSLVRVTLFVEDLQKQTEFYRDALNLPAVDIRNGWSEFGEGEVTIALHRGKGRRPRLEFTTDWDLEEIRTHLNAKGARLGPIRELLGKRFVSGKDKDGNTIKIYRRE